MTRLALFPLSLGQLELCLHNLPSLGKRLGFPIDSQVLDENVTRAIRMKIIKLENSPPEKHHWHTYWLIVVEDADNQKIGAGFIGFKGYPNAEGEAEIGYGLAPQQRGKGYMVEAVQLLCDWAFRNPACKAITATTVTNPASNRVLEKVGAVMVAQDGQSTNWKIYRKG